MTSKKEALFSLSSTATIPCGWVTSALMLTRVSGQVGHVMLHISPDII